MNDGVDVGGPPSGGSPTRIGHALTDGPLPFRKIMDVGIQSYDEFACSVATLSWMEANSIPRDARLQVVERCHGGHNVIVKAWPK